MMLSGSCHCGAVRMSVPTEPEWVASCNCSICRRTGALMAYYPDDGSVRIEGDTATYIHGDRMIALHHCPVCACHTHWETTGASYGRMGVNARLLDGFEVLGAKGEPGFAIGGRRLEVRFFDNAD